MSPATGRHLADELGARRNRLEVDSARQIDGRETVDMLGFGLHSAASVLRAAAGVETLQRTDALCSLIEHRGALPGSAGVVKKGRVAYRLLVQKNGRAGVTWSDYLRMPSPSELFHSEPDLRSQILHYIAALCLTYLHTAGLRSS